MSDPLPLFPLNTVLFPGVVMPLYVFEDRYRALVRDLLALPAERDPEFGVVAIKVGYEVGERGVHTIQRTGCAALVTDVNRNPGGSFEIVVVGRRRFQVRSLDPTRSYLRAAVEWLPDRAGGRTPDDAVRAAATARELFGLYRETLEELRGEDVLDGDTPHDPVDLSYTLAAALVLPLAERQSLLEAPDVVTRLLLATSMMRAELLAIAALPSLPATSMARTQWSAN